MKHTNSGISTSYCSYTCKHDTSLFVLQQNFSWGYQPPFREIPTCIRTIQQYDVVVTVPAYVHTVNSSSCSCKSYLPTWAGMPSAGLARFGRASEGTSAASLLLAELLEALGDAMPAGGGGPGAAASASARPSPSSIGITLAVAKFSTAPRLRQNSSYASQLPAQASWIGMVPSRTMTMMMMVVLQRQRLK